MQKNKAALLFGIIANDSIDFVEIEDKLIERYGPISEQSSLIKFDHTTYYNAEMGKVLYRKYLVFENQIDKDELPDIKLFANQIEDSYARDCKRSVNLDPGYFDLARLVLASTKDFSHRIYVRNNIYAEITLIYKGHTFTSLAWTYPDYKSDFAIVFFNKARKNYYNKCFKS